MKIENIPVLNSCSFTVAYSPILIFKETKTKKCNKQTEIDITPEIKSSFTKKSLNLKNRTKNNNKNKK